MLTEEQARTKWCPMAQVESSPAFQAVRDPTSGEVVVPMLGTVPVNRGGTREEVCCVASNCMMWRWFDPNERATVFERRGYCGLAGKLEIGT